MAPLLRRSGADKGAALTCSDVASPRIRGAHQVARYARASDMDGDVTRQKLCALLELPHPANSKSCYCRAPRRRGGRVRVVAGSEVRPTQRRIGEQAAQYHYLAWLEVLASIFFRDVSEV